MLRKGDAQEVYYNLHQKYGPIVRTAPGVVSISDPRTVPTIYGIGTKFYKVRSISRQLTMLGLHFYSFTFSFQKKIAPRLNFDANILSNTIQSAFYSVFDMSYKGELMPSMFSVRDPAGHQALRRPVAQKFSMSSIKAMEPFADDCNDIFIEAMKDLEGQDVDLGIWLQWYAFDVISAITFHRRFGFMEQRRDIQNMISDISSALEVGATIGQVPGLHPWLMGSKWLPMLLAWQPFAHVPDPLRTVVKVSYDSLLLLLVINTNITSSLPKTAFQTMTGILHSKTGRTSWAG